MVVAEIIFCSLACWHKQFSPSSVPVKELCVRYKKVVTNHTEHFIC